MRIVAAVGAVAAAADAGYYVGLVDYVAAVVVDGFEAGVVVVDVVVGADGRRLPLGAGGVAAGGELAGVGVAAAADVHRWDI